MWLEILERPGILILINPQGMVCPFKTDSEATEACLKIASGIEYTDNICCTKGKISMYTATVIPK